MGFGLLVRGGFDRPMPSAISSRRAPMVLWCLIPKRTYTRLPQNILVSYEVLQSAQNRGSGSREL